MSDGISIDLIILAAVAAFFAFKLRSVLGRRTGNERRPGPMGGPPAENDGDNVVPLPNRRQPPPFEPSKEQSAKGEARSGVADIRARDPHFDLQGFAAGAQTAFGMIVEAFAAGDKNALRPLLADNVFANFAAAIDDRGEKGERLQTELIAIDEASVVEAGMAGDMARVTLKFRSEQINIVRDSDGKVIDGDPSKPEEVVDIWTFERDVTNSDPNWALVATSAGDDGAGPDGAGHDSAGQ